jgi:hypothetical protein
MVVEGKRVDGDMVVEGVGLGRDRGVESGGVVRWE